MAAVAITCSYAMFLARCETEAGLVMQVPARDGYPGGGSFCIFSFQALSFASRLRSSTYSPKTISWLQR